MLKPERDRGAPSIFESDRPALHSWRDDASDQLLDGARIIGAVGEIAERRSVIDQAKGVLMLYGIDADAAFALLWWQSQVQNVKLRLLAAQVGRQRCPAPNPFYSPVTLPAHDAVVAGCAETARSVVNGF